MTSASNPIFSGHFGDGRVTRDGVYYIRSVGIADTAWSAESNKGGAISTINNVSMHLPVQFIESLCDTKRTFVSIIPVASENMQANAKFVLSFDPHTKVLTVRQTPNPIDRSSLDVHLTTTVSGICRPNDQYGSTPDGTRVWVANTCHGEFERNDGLAVTCSAPELKYSECPFPADDSYIDVVTGSCFELVPGLDTSADRGLSIRVGWLGDPDTYLMVDIGDNALVKAMPFLDTPDYRRKATWIIDKAIDSPSTSPDTPSINFLNVTLPADQLPTSTTAPPAQSPASEEFFTPLVIAIMVIGGVFLGVGGFYLQKYLQNNKKSEVVFNPD